MTDRQKVYTKTHQKLKELLKGQKQGHIATLAMMVASIVLGSSDHLSKIAEATECQNQQTHKSEISCNGQDDDCDGKTDEVGCQKGYGCSAGICKLCTQPGPWRCKKFLGVCTKSAKRSQSCKCGYTCRCTDGATFTNCAKAECKP